MPSAYALDTSRDVSKYGHTVWRTLDGLAPGTIGPITQTSDGYLWLGTPTGVVRFDGVRSVPWRPNSGTALPDERVRALLGTRDGALWVGTFRGLARWRGGELRTYDSLKGKAINALTEDAEGSVWVGGVAGERGFVCVVEPHASDCRTLTDAFDKRVAALTHDANGALWAAAGDRVLRIRPGPAIEIRLNHRVGALQTMAAADDGVLVATAGDVVKVRGNVLEPLSLPPWAKSLQFTKILRDRDGGIWIAAADFGLLHLHDGRVDAYTGADGLSGDHVLGLFEDREGNIWVSTTNGLDRFRSTAAAIYSRGDGIKGRVASVLAARDGSLWTSTTVAVYRLEHGTVSEMRPARSATLFEDRTGRVWMASQNDLGYFQGGRFAQLPDLPPGTLDGLTEDAKGNLWFAYRDQGLLRLRPDGQVERARWPDFGKRGSVATMIVDSKDDSLWLGTWSGAVMNLRDGVVSWAQDLREASDGPGAGVAQLRLDSQGALWVAGRSVLTRIHNGRANRLGKSSGMPCDGAFWTLEDERWTWVYTSCGLVQIARDELQAWSDAVATGADRQVKVKLLDRARGIGQPSNVSAVGQLERVQLFTPKVAHTSDGRVWFVTGDGLSAVDPARIPFNDIAPPVHIEELVADGRAFQPAASLRLPPLQRDLRIDYTALSLTAAELVRFRYKLEGRDSGWQDAGNRRQAFYTDLEPGRYRFRVVAANDSNVWNETGASLEFTVEPAWWQTTAFRAACVSGFALMLYLLYRLRIAQISWRFDMVDKVPGLVLTLTPTGGLEFVNGGTVGYLGMGLSEAEKWAANGIVHREDLPRVEPLFQHGVSAGEPFEYEVRLRRSDGKYRWFQLRASALRNSAGSVKRWYVLLTDIDQLKHAEEAQRRSEQELGLIVDTIPALVAICTATGEVEFENNRTREYLGPGLAGTGEWGSNGIVCPDDMARVVPLFEAGVQAGEPFEYEVRLRHEGGIYRWFQMRASPLRDANGGVVRWYCLFTDIHEKRRVEQALKQSEVELRRSESNLRLTIDTIPALAWSARADGTADFFNQHYLEYVGSSLVQLRDWNWTSTIHGDDLGVIFDAWERFRAASQGGAIEARIRRHDGTYRWFLLRFNPLLDSSGNVIKWFGVNTDIEDRKIAEAALKRSETFLAEGQRISSTGSFSWRLATDELTFSDELNRIFGFQPDAVATFERIAERVHPEDQPLLAEKLAEVRAGHDNGEYEVRLQMPDGTVKHVRVFGRVFRQLDGTLECLGAVQDVTRRILAEDALGKVRSELAHVTRMMSFSALTASIAHEVNQPIAGIITNANTCVRMLAATPPDVAGAMETARRTIRDGNRASDVVVRLRKLFSKETQRSERIDLNQAAAEVIALVMGDLQRNQVVVETDFADSLPAVAADRVQLQQVILNFVTNASDAMSEIRGRQRLAIIRTSRDGNERLKLSVRDTGVGVRSEDLEQVFQPFFTTKSSGMGIGLSVSRSIIESHRGRVWVEPNPNGGATFAFSIPVAADSSGAS